MKKPDRKAFQREYGPRAAAKYVTAMQKYRKFLKNQPKPKAETKTETKAKTPAKVTGVGPVASGAEYGRKLQKERQAKTPQPKAEVKPKPNQNQSQNQSKPHLKKPRAGSLVLLAALTVKICRFSRSLSHNLKNLLVVISLQDGLELRRIQKLCWLKEANKIVSS